MKVVAQRIHKDVSGVNARRLYNKMKIQSYSDRGIDNKTIAKYVARVKNLNAVRLCVDIGDTRYHLNRKTGLGCYKDGKGNRVYIDNDDSVIGIKKL